MFLEGTLLEKLRKIEALHAGTTVDGEREAARRAAERIRARLAELRGSEKDVELLYRLPDPWTRRLFLALCRRYGLRPYRESGRRYSTIQVRAPKTFHERTLWPEFQALSKELRTHLDELTERVIREAIDEDVSEAAEAGTQKALPESSTG
jgi:hypothetical protein